ncbi:hypothetical protein WN51_09386 [Melipona quadrifasciata]|uniref:Uncharacterized protein n=1 Tax=Melipona quadrifasciata TaxID=166423 RepID=A0A0N0U6G1_9HYME|nr:hypothetical protein WN51_09386 [Melipona quadrifasciata]
MNQASQDFPTKSEKFSELSRGFPKAAGAEVGEVGMFAGSARHASSKKSNEATIPGCLQEAENHWDEIAEQRLKGWRVECRRSDKEMTNCERDFLSCTLNCTLENFSECELESRQLATVYKEMINP